jgi:hypothetical protein
VIDYEAMIEKVWKKYGGDLMDKSDFVKAARHIVIVMELEAVAVRMQDERAKLQHSKGEIIQ